MYHLTVSQTNCFKLQHQKQQILFFHLNLSMKTFSSLRSSMGNNPSLLLDNRKHLPFSLAPQVAGKLHPLKKSDGNDTDKSSNEPQVRL